MNTLTKTITAETGPQNTSETKTKKNILMRLKEILIEKKPDVKKLGMMTAVEVMALAHAEQGLELYPFHLYKGQMKGALECKHKVPMMKKLVSVKRKEKWRSATNTERIIYKPMIDEIYTRGYILPEEICRLKKGKFIVITEDEPSLFIIAPKTQKSQSKEYIPSPAPKDPIVLIKYGKNAYLPLHSRDNSQMLDAKLSRLN